MDSAVKSWRRVVAMLAGSWLLVVISVAPQVAVAEQTGNPDPTRELKDNFQSEVATWTADQHSFGNLDAKILERYDRSTALVRLDETGRRTIVTSSLPWWTSQGEPVDLALSKESGSEFKPESPLVDMSLPVKTSDPVLLKESIELDLMGLGRTSTARGIFHEDERLAALFYEDAYPGADLILTPTPTGVRTYWQVHGQSSPTSYSVDLKMPSGYLVQATTEGGAEVLDEHGRAQLNISPPASLDAQGDDVPTRLAVVGDVVTVEVDHRAGDFAYPILVDPVYDGWDWEGGTTTGYNQWLWSTSAAAKFDWTRACRPNVAPASCFGSGTGLFVWAKPGTSYVNGDRAYWTYTAPGTTGYVSAAYLGGLRYNKGSSGAAQPHGMATLSTSAGTEVTATHYTATTPTTNSVSLVGNSTTRKVQLGIKGTANGTLSSGNAHNRWIQAGTAIVALDDTDNPTISVPSGQHPTGWVSESTNLQVNSTSADNGLGWTATELLATRFGHLGWEAVDAAVDETCTGTLTNPCLSSKNWTSNYTGLLDEGLNTLKLQTTDILGKTATSSTWSIYVDRFAPNVSTGGSIVRRNNQTVAAGTLDLSAVATDDAGQEEYGASGIASMSIRLNGVTKASAGTSCTGIACTKRLVYSVPVTDLAIGLNTVEVRATDHVGHTTIKQFKIERAAEALKSPRTGDQSSRRFQLEAEAPGTTWTGVRYQYRRTSVDPWTSVPTSMVLDEDGAEISSWPVSVDSGTVAPLVWDAWNSPGLNSEGPLEVRALFSQSGQPDKATPAVVATLVRSRSATDSNSLEMGPGSLNLLAGSMQIGTNDVEIKAPGGNLVLNRSLTTGNAASISSGPLGGGWTLGVGGGATEATYLSAQESSTQVAIATAEGRTIYFQSLGSNTYKPEADFSYLYLEKNGSSFVLSEVGGGRTVFSPKSTNYYVASEIYAPGVGDSLTVNYSSISGTWRPTRLIAPSPQGVDCSNPNTPGCRSLVIDYATSTTATGTAEANWGNYLNQVKEVSFVGANPSTGVMETTSVQKYLYDNTGFLRAAWDSRISPSLKTRYTYAAGRPVSIQEPGQAPWVFTYGSELGQDPSRIYAVSRLVDSELVRTTGFVYDVPLSGTGSPRDMRPSDVAEWGQEDVPTDAVAVIPPSEELSIEDATTFYLNRNGDIVNRLAPSGSLSVTEYNESGSPWRQLSAENLETALAETDPAAASALLDTRRIYSSDGLEVVEELRPETTVTLKSGASVLGRPRTTFEYDDGAPAILHLLTAETRGVLRSDTSQFVDQERTVYGYLDGGWKFKRATTVTEDPAGLNIRRLKILDPYYGFEIGRVQPNYGHVLTSYYSAGAHSDSDCANAPGYAGDVCKVASSSGTARYYYDRWLNETLVVETSGTKQRNTYYIRDAAGRITQEHRGIVSGATDPYVSTVYDSSTGLPTAISSTEGSTTKTVTMAYDEFGSVTSSMDEWGVVSTRTYDDQGRVVSSHDGKGLTEYDYDEDGNVVSSDDSVSGEIVSSYDADGNVLSERHQSGLGVEVNYDTNGQAVSRSYFYDDGSGQETLRSESVTHGATGRWLERQWGEPSGLGQTDKYTYDGIGRLTKAESLDTAGSCSARRYSFDSNSNRTKLEVVGQVSASTCGSNAATSTTNYSYSGDRLTGGGVATDEFGRVTALPAQYAGGSSFSATYYTNDRVSSMSQGGVTTSYSYDGVGRVSKIDSTGSTTKKLHYTGIEEGNNWTGSGNDWDRTSIGPGGILTLGASGDLGGLNGLDVQVVDMHGDSVGSISTLTPDPEIFGRVAFDEFGNTGGQQAVGGKGWVGGTGRLVGSPGGAILMGARVYMPSLGRFLQVDPIVGGSANDYDYANQDPVNLLDPTGEGLVEDAWDFVKGAGKAVIGAGKKCWDYGTKCAVKVGEKIFRTAKALGGFLLKMGAKAGRVVKSLGRLGWSVLVAAYRISVALGGSRPETFGCILGIARYWNSIASAGRAGWWGMAIAAGVACYLGAKTRVSK